jgi:DNA-binding response OmpR family regulator
MEEVPVSKDREINILLVEDDPDHMELTFEAIKATNINHNVIWIRKGDDVLRFLDREGIYQDPWLYPFPDLILLDLNLALTDGWDVLRSLRAREDSVSIPVIALTSCQNDEETEECLGLGATDVMVKPVSSTELLAKLRMVPFNLAPGGTHAAGSPGPMSKVLLIEDDADHREVMRASLEFEMPYLSIEETGNPADALGMLGRENYDVIVVDYRLPKMDGIKFLKKSRKLRVNSPTIMVTGYANEKIAVKAFKLGAMDYLVKNMELPKRLSRTVKGILTSRGNNGANDENDDGYPEGNAPKVRIQENGPKRFRGF